MNDDSHDCDVAAAFDGQAAQFEMAPVQSDPAMLARLVAFAAFPPGTSVLDAGCGPGLVSEALAAAGNQVLGVDLSSEMIHRAQNRCARFGERVSFQQGSVVDVSADARFGGAVSRYVLHHVLDPAEFVQAQVAHLEPGGVLIACDHTTDPAPAQAEAHQAIEKARDLTHTRNLTTGELLDLFALAGLTELSSREEGFSLDFDEWFDRGTPAAPKNEVRAQVLACRARGFTAAEQPGGAVTISCWRSYVRGVKP
ncbi:MAG: class I SAM-dependent methyltransferase [Polyangia bacterium]